MDFRNICSKIDMDAIRAKLPALPDVMTQFKLPKSMSKLKSRSKIFRSSQEDVTSDMKRSSTVDVGQQHSLAIPPSDFVDHTPQRISTISSLVDLPAAGGKRARPPGAAAKRKNPHQEAENFYRNAGGIDDYCPSPLDNTISNVQDLPVSPGGKATTDDAVKLSIVERMQKGYKDAADFKFKSIFVKKTVVRQDDIALNHYIEQYTADRKRQERYEDKIDRAIADNFEFEFKTSRRKSEESFGISTPSDSPVNKKSNTNKKLLSEHSSDESGMELSPPARKPGIASTRFSRVRNVPLRMSIDEDDDINQVPRYDDDDEEIPVQNTQHAGRRQKSEEIEDSKPSPPKIKSFKKRFGSLTRQTSQGQSSQENIASPKKRRAPFSPQQSEELEELDVVDITAPASKPSSPPEAKQAKPFVAIKENFKRFQKSFKLSSSSLGPSGAESEVDEANDKTKQSKTQQFAERLKRFRSVDNVDRQTEDEQERENKTQESPMHKFTNKLQEWKKSMKRKPQTQNTEDEEAQDTSPQKREKPAGTLMKKLRHIRSRKHPSTDDPDEDEEGGATYREGFRSRAKLQLEKGVAAASQMPQMTMEKIRETKKYFRKTQDKDKEKNKDNDKESKQKATKNDSGESDLEESDTDSPKKQRSAAKVYPKVKDSGRPTITRHYYSSDDEDEEDEYDRQQQSLCRVTALEPNQPKVLVPLSRAAWTNKSIHSDSMDTGDDDDDILPRVLIHQDNSDVFESTIIIAVTRPITRSHSPSPYITELPPDSPKVSSPETKADSWVPSREIISSPQTASEPIKREISKDTIASSSSRGHSRKHSMDSSSDDSWIKDVPRGISTAVGLNSLHEMDEPWRVQTGKKDEKLYKTKSIDIFEKAGGLKIFEDFDDELKYTPVVKIEDQPEAKIVNEDSFEQDSGEELEDNPDDDNSSRVTRILKQPEDVKLEDVSTPPIKPRDIKLKTHLYGNSTESLMGHLDAKSYSDDKDADEESDDEAEEDDEDDSDEVYNRPPSAAPSPPPSMSPPPPPLPERQPSLRLSKMQMLPQAPPLPPIPPPPDELPPSPPRSIPPLPQTKPPIPPNRPVVPAAPPKVPERTPSMSRVAKPLVKTSSLRLAYDEQVNPKDVGKVNKLISRFEPNGGFKERPRIIPRIPYMSQSSEDYSEDDEDDASEDNDVNDNEDENNEDTQNGTNAREKSLEKTPTNKPTMQKTFSIDSDNITPLLPLINNNPEPRIEELPISTRKSTKTTKPPAPSTIIPSSQLPPPPPPPPREAAPSPPVVPSISISSIPRQSDQNSNFSQPSSEYGSPMAYPSSRMGSTDVTPLSSPKDMVFLSSRRSRRSMTRDDEKYFSFDSDEENSYYSISSTNSNRYVVDL